MVQQPSKQLQNILFGKQLCSQRDLRNCVARAKKLSADLPAFDSVWLDALVQNRKLTAFQSQSIEAHETENLRIGPFIVVDRLGHGPAGDTFLARRPQIKDLTTIKRVSVPPELETQSLNALQKLVDAANSSERLPNLVLPTCCNVVAPEKDNFKTQLPDASTRGVGRIQASPTKAVVELAIISRYVPGLPLTQLMLRRGRFESAVVARIARSLLTALGSLFQRKLIHGEVTLDNVLLTHGGQVTLVDAGVATALQPTFQINAFVEPHRNDNIAPELIGTGNRATPASDLYALGCLLWHLLAGRPPFPTGDPLSKLAYHQTTRIPDIREIAPETSDQLANTILWLTEPNANARPKHAGQLLGTVTVKKQRDDKKNAAAAKTKSVSIRGTHATPSMNSMGRTKVSVKPDRERSHSIGSPKSGDRRRLAKFAKSFHHPTVRKRAAAARPRVSKQMMLAVASVCLACCGLAFWNHADRDWPILSFLQQPSDAAEAYSQSSQDSQNPGSTIESMETWPQPDAAGVVQLAAGKSYSADRLVWTGQRLTIRGDQDAPPRILVEGSPLRLQASNVVIEHVDIELAAAHTRNASGLNSLSSHEQSNAGQSNARMTSAPRALVIVESQTLKLAGCNIHSALNRQPSTGRASSQSQYALAWAPLDSSDRLSGKISIDNSTIVGDWSTVLLAGRSHQVQCNNSLQVGPGPFFALHQTDRPAQDSIELTNTTLRASGGLVAVQLQKNRPWQSRLTLVHNQSVFDLQSPTTATSPAKHTLAPLVTFVGSKIIPHWHEAIQIDGSSSVINRTAVLAALQSPDGTIRKPLTNATPRVRGIVSSGVQYAGLDLYEATNSIVTQVEANWHSESFPGLSP